MQVFLTDGNMDLLNMTNSSLKISHGHERA